MSPARSGTASDDDVLARFRQGDETAVREVFRRYGGAVQTVAKSMVSSPDLVNEVVQETFVKAWKAAASYDEQREFTPWLYSIARRTAIDVVRREARREAAELDDNQPAVAGMSFERTWEIYEVRKALDELPDQERSVLKMMFLAGLGHAQISEQLGIPVGTVKSRANRGKKRLAVALGHISEDVANPATVSDVQGGEKEP